MKNKLMSKIVREVSEEEWLFDPKNKALVDELTKALTQKADREIDLSSFEDK